MTGSEPRSVRHRRRLLYLCVAMMDLSIGMVLFAIPLFLIKELHTTVFMVGLTGGLASFGYSISCLGTGRLSDRFGRKKVVAMGVAVSICVYMAISQVRDIPPVIGLGVLGGMGFAMFWPPVQAWVAESTQRESLRTTLGVFNIAWSSGLMVGPLIAGLLFPLGYRVPFYFACGQGVILLFIILRLSEEPGRQASVGTEVSAVGGGIDKTAFLFIAWLANFVSWFIAGMMRNIFPVLAVSLKIDPRTLGFLLFLLGFSQTWMFVLLRRVGGWHYRIGPLLLCQVLASVALVIGFLTSATILFALSFILIGTLTGMSYFSSILYSQDSLTSRGCRAGYHESILGIGGLLGPICGGLVAKYYGLRAPYISCLILVLGAMLVQVVIYRNSLRRKA